MYKTITLNSKFQIKSEAGYLDNPNVKRVSFIITDDKPNANYEGIRADQFLQLAASAMYMPIKMAVGEISPGHAGTMPLGVIIGTEIQEGTEATRIYGEGALWQRERPADVNYFSNIANSQGAYLSWEIAYTDAEIDESGVSWLLDPTLLAVTIVGNPAYGNRTPIVTASIEGEDMQKDTVVVPEEKAQEELQEDTVQEETVIEETVVEKVLTEEEISLYDEQLRELDELREFKRKFDEAEALKQRIAEIKEALPEISEDNARILAGVTPEQLNVIRTLLSSKRSVSSKERQETVIPEFSLRNDDDPVRTLVAYLSSFGGHNAS